MKKCMLLLIVPILFLSAQPVLADMKKITFSWEYSGEPDTFRVYERIESGKEVLIDVPGTEKSAEVIKDLDPINCSTFYLAAITDGIESNAPNGMTWCPEPTLPPYIQRPISITTQNISITVAPAQ